MIWDSRSVQRKKARRTFLRAERERRVRSDREEGREGARGFISSLFEGVFHPAQNCRGVCLVLSGRENWCVLALGMLRMGI